MNAIDQLIQSAQSGSKKGALAPLLQLNTDRITAGSKPYSTTQNLVASQAILQHSSPLHKDPGNHGILSDIVHLPGNFLSDATNTIQGFFSPWKWVPTLWHNFETGNMNALLPLIPGYTTASHILGGDWHDILTHPVGTTLDVLPYAHYALPAIADISYGSLGSEASHLPEEAAKTADALKGTAGEVAGPAKVIQGTTETSAGGTLLSRESRIEAAMRAGKPGSLLFNLLPDTLSSPETGMIGRRLENLREKVSTSAMSNAANRKFQIVVNNEYIKPLKALFDSWTPSDRKGFAMWWENRNDLTPGVWKDVTGVEHPVPQNFLEVAPQVEEIVKSFEKKFGEYFHEVQWNGKSYLYDPRSPVVRAGSALEKARTELANLRTSAEDRKDGWLGHLNTPAPGSTLARSRDSLFKLKDRITREQARFDRILQQRAMVTDRAKYLQLSERLDKIRAFLEKAQAQHDLLSQREMLHWRLSQPENSVYHVSPEEYHLLDIKDPGTTAAGRAYLKELKKLDDAHKNYDAARRSYDKILKNNAPATFYPHIRDQVLQRMVEKYKTLHPDFAEKTTEFSWEETKKAFDQATLGRNPVDAGLATDKELNQQIHEVESTWQELANQGFHPMYLSTVPADRMKSVLDPNLFKSGALRDEPYAVKSRVRDVTPSGIHDPVIGLTAPALALVRKKALQEFYTAYLGKFIKDQADLQSWVDKEIQAGTFKLEPGQDYMSLRNDIIRKRWSVFDAKDVDPEFAKLFEGEGKIYLPREMYDSIKKLFSPVDHELVSASKANITGLRVFRTSIMTASAKHLAHILFGGMTMLMMRGGLEEWSPARMMEAYHLIKDQQYPSELATGVDFYSSEQVKAGLTPRGERETLGQKAVGTIGDVVAKIQHGEEFVSNWQRALSYLSERDRIMNMLDKGGYSPDLTLFENGEVKAALERKDYEHAMDLAKRGGIRHANKALVNFDNMLPAERGIIRNIFPFYAFTRHIFKTVFTYPMDYPLRASFVYRVGEMQQKAWDETGLPNDWMRYWTFGPDASGNETGVDLRFINPFRTMPAETSLSGIGGSLNPFLGFMLEWAGVNRFSTSAQRNAQVAYNPETGFVDTKRPPLSPMDFIKEFVPEVGVADIFTGKVKPGDVYNKIPTYGFIPGWPYHLNVNKTRAQDAIGQLQEAQQAISDALRTGNTDAVRQWNLVPLQGQLVPGSKIADIIDHLKGKGTPRQQLGLR